MGICTSGTCPHVGNLKAIGRRSCVDSDDISKEKTGACISGACPHERNVKAIGASDKVIRRRRAQIVSRRFIDIIPPTPLRNKGGIADDLGVERRGADSNRRIEVLQTSPLAAWVPRQQYHFQRGFSLERAMGLEPTTFCMASRRSTTELHPRNHALT
jgi:hypothetical protein